MGDSLQTLLLALMSQPGNFAVAVIAIVAFLALVVIAVVAIAMSKRNFQFSRKSGDTHIEVATSQDDD